MKTTFSLRTAFSIASLIFAISFFGSVCFADAPLRHWPIVERGEQDVQEEQNVSVHELQLLLAAHGEKIPADGLFGKTTQKALSRFQQRHRLAATGKTNNPTWEALIMPVHQGSTGPAVKAVQLQLRAEGYAVPANGIFDARMKAAVRQFQQHTGHTADGVVGRNTWYELLGGTEFGND